MKKAFLKFKPYLLLFLCLLAISLFIVSGCLYQQNHDYRKENRKLIIQNDSIISVNIELKNALNEKTTMRRNFSERIKE